MGHNLQDNHTLQDYNVISDSTITINLCLRGGCSGSSSKNTGSFKDTVKGKGNTSPTTATEPPRPYIVEQTPESPSLTINIAEVKTIYSNLHTSAVICRFNGFWPRSDVLHQWIHTAWTKKCEIYLYPKGFFIVRFHKVEEMDIFLNQGPWFWCSAGLFITPWFPNFDANTMVVSKMPFWVRLPNLPLHFWHQKVLTAIGNTLGKHIKTDAERHLKWIFTFASICVEVDLSQGLPESIILNFNNTQWTQPLDYENTTFWCRGCQQTGHLHSACPRTSPNRNKQQQRKSKGRQNIETLVLKVARAEKVEHKAKEDEQKIQDNRKQENNLEQEQELQLEVSGIKQTHSSEGLDSDKEQPTNTMENQLAIIDPTPNTDGWRRVEKKKGKKT